MFKNIFPSKLDRAVYKIDTPSSEPEAQQKAEGDPKAARRILARAVEYAKTNEERVSSKLPAKLSEALEKATYAELKETGIAILEGPILRNRPEIKDYLLAEFEDETSANKDRLTWAIQTFIAVYPVHQDIAAQVLGVES